MNREGWARDCRASVQGNRGASSDLLPAAGHIHLVSSGQKEMLFLERSASGKRGRGKCRGGSLRFHTGTANRSRGTWERAGEHKVFEASECFFGMYD